MQFQQTSLRGAFVVSLEAATDSRGFFARTWCSREFAAHGLPDTLVQSSMSRSEQRGTVRGMHVQLPPSREAKLVRCTRGAIYDVIVDMAFHPQYWARPVRNTSSGYNYQEWNRVSRFNAAQQIGVDTRVQPKATEPVEMLPDIRLLPPPGGLLIFSAAQLHSSVENTSGRTRFSIDFRTVHRDDVRDFRGAPNVDSHCTGSTMGDYLRGTDLSKLSTDLMAPYDAGPPQQALAKGA